VRCEDQTCWSPLSISKHLHTAPPLPPALFMRHTTPSLPLHWAAPETHAHENLATRVQGSTQEGPCPPILLHPSYPRPPSGKWSEVVHQPCLPSPSLGCGPRAFPTTAFPCPRHCQSVSLGGSGKAGVPVLLVQPRAESCAYRPCYFCHPAGIWL
jgi:hypothetical protein